MEETHRRESETAHELGEFLIAQGVAGRRVAVQHHGSGADGLAAQKVLASAIESLEHETVVYVR